VIDVTVSQGGNSKQVSLRVPELAPDAEVNVLELNVRKHQGAVYVQGSVTSDEGKQDWQQRL
jgi:hypothetical protein